MVGAFEGTVGYDKETVAFNNAVEFVKKKNRIFYKEISEKIGLTKEQGEQIRAGRRKASNVDISNLVKHYPESATFFVKLENDASYENQTLNEPMGTHFYGKKEENPWQELAGVQKKLLEKQEFELAALREKVRQLEVEKKVLTDTIEGILSPKQ